MSDDIAERLRKRAYRLAAKDFNGDGAKLAMEAADEITRLRAELAAVTAEREQCAKAVEKVAKKINVAPHERPAYEDGYLQGVHDAAAAIMSGK